MKTVIYNIVVLLLAALSFVSIDRGLSFEWISEDFSMEIDLTVGLNEHEDPETIEINLEVVENVIGNLTNTAPANVSELDTADWEICFSEFEYSFYKGLSSKNNDRPPRA